MIGCATFLIFCAIGYVVGSIPFGYLYTKYTIGIDLKNFGSGSTGSTNVLRTGSKKLALCTLISDALKGVVTTTLALALYNLNLGLFVGASCIIGHVYPIWLLFKGGKGAATVGGVFMALSPLTASASAIIWLVTAKFTKISSLASLIFCLSFVVITFFRVILGSEDPKIAIFSAFAFAFLLCTHRDNLKRLISQSESKF